MERTLAGEGEMSTMQIKWTQEDSKRAKPLLMGKGWLSSKSGNKTYKRKGKRLGGVPIIKKSTEPRVT